MFPGSIVVVHVLAVFWLIAGILGRATCYHLALRTDRLAALRERMEIGGVFERAMVRPATFVVLLTGLLAAWLRGWPILGFLQGGPVNWVLAALAIYLSIVPVIVFIFVPRGRVYHAALEEATASGEITVRLRAALEDPLVNAARGYEIVMVLTVTWLMVMKPF